MEKPTHLYALILAGGSGTRLWPKSVKKSPKHLLNLHTDVSMITETVERIRPIVSDHNIFVVTKADQVDDIKKELPFLDQNHFIAEPTGKNTAWAMGLGAYYIRKENPDAVVVNLAADHIIAPQEKFEEAVLAAEAAARLGDYLVTLGIVPTFPHTGLGYIKIGEFFKDVVGTHVYTVDSFTEKPDLATAQEFLATGKYFWNANLYTWHVNSIATALKNHAPQVYDALEQIYQVIGTPDEPNILADVYEAAEDLQIDKGVSEKSNNLLLIKAPFAWNDIGDWSVLYDIKEKDQDNNVFVGETNNVINIGSKNSLIESSGRLIAAIGLDNIIIIDTPNATLICHKDKVQDVKKVVEKLKADERHEHL